MHAGYDHGQSRPQLGFLGQVGRQGHSLPKGLPSSGIVRFCAQGGSVPSLCTRASGAPARITFADVPLATTSHWDKSQVHVGGGYTKASILRDVVHGELSM